MIAIKYIILSLVFAGCFLIGNLVSKKYVNRVKELKEIKNALSMFEIKMRFTYESIPEIFLDISKQIDGVIGEIFKKASEMMDFMSACDAWNNSIDTIDNVNINKEDKAILKNLGKLLGKTDIDGQISEIKLVSEFIDTQIKNAEIEQKKNEKVYKTLGGIVGLTIVIILL